MDDTTLNVPVRTRTHELDQLHEFFPAVEDGLRKAELDEAADEVARIYEEHVSGDEPTLVADDRFRAWVSMPPEDWRMTVRYLGRLRSSEGLRSEWLRTKLVDRLEDRLEDMD